MLDTLEVQVEVDEATFSDEVKQLQALAQSIQRKIKDYFTVSVKVKLVEPQSIPRSEGKAKRVIDKRPAVKGRQEVTSMLVPKVGGRTRRPANPPKAHLGQVGLKPFLGRLFP